MIDRAQIVRALADRKAFADWVVVERVTERAVVAATTMTKRREHTTRWSLVLHVDLPEGRGSVHLELGPLDIDLGDLLDQAAALAATAVGQSWSSMPQAAPAKVDLLDPALETVDLVDTATALGRALPATASDAMIELARTRHRIDARSGLVREWTSSHVRTRCVVTSGRRSLVVAREARRLVDLGLDAAISAAGEDLSQMAAATTARPGRCALVITPDALLHGGGYGMWQVFVDQADATRERQGLTRYPLGKPVAAGADTAAEPLFIASDGAQPFGARSAPIGDDGDAVRRFVIVEGGVAVGLGMNPRDAAIRKDRKSEPNGGIRNLEVGVGTWAGERPAGRVVELRRLRSLTIDRFTGDASLEVGLGLDGEVPFSGGTIRLDLVAALALARRSNGTPIQRGPYRGPNAVLLPEVDLVV